MEGRRGEISCTIGETNRELVGVEDKWWIYRRVELSSFNGVDLVG